MPGPISSNWDRACEIYAMLHGGIVDYGVAHSLKYGHKRFGRTYPAPGLLPNWGQDANSKVHLIAHSMGGQTARLLAQLLACGDANERSATTAEGLSPLFAASQTALVASVTTLATPHNGTTLSPAVVNSVPGARFELSKAISNALRVIPNKAIDFKLEQGD